MPCIWPFRICGHDSKKISREKKIRRTLKVGMTNPRSRKNKAQPRENYEKQWKMFISYRGIKYVHFLPNKIVPAISHVMRKTCLHLCFHIILMYLHIMYRYSYIYIILKFLKLNHNSIHLEYVYIYNYLYLKL